MKASEEKKHTTVFQNIYQVLKVMFTCYPKAKWKTIALIIFQVGEPLLITAVPSIAIAAITEGKIGYYLLCMVGVLLCLGMLKAARDILDLDAFLCRINCRMQWFIPRFVKKVLTMDYSKVEPYKYQKKIREALESVNSNSSGAERLMYEVPNLVMKSAGLLTYGITILMLDVRIIVVMVVMCVIDILLRSHAISYSSKSWGENVDIYGQMKYIENEALDLKAGKDVRIYQMKPWFHKTYDKLIKREVSLASKIQLRWYFPTLADAGFVVIRDLLAYFILVSQAVAGEISPAMFTFYLGVIADFAFWFYGFSENFSAIRKAAKEHDFYRAIMDEKEVSEADGQLKAPVGKGFSIEFKNVCFRYEDAEEDTIHNLNLKINVGEKIAIVGNNGAGKTTLVKLLCGLYHPSSGEIFVDGIDITTLNRTDYQKRISVLFQDIEPFHFTIASNVCAGEDDCNCSQRLKESLQKAELWEKVISLPYKENTYIFQTFDKDGIQLSGGETQKLLLARAIYKNGDFLILDEPTSALDPIAESHIYEQYNQLAKNKTAIFISHRLASTKFCERIIFLENGKVREEGSHEELMMAGGEYRKIFDIQNHYYKKKGDMTNDLEIVENDPLSE